jgi:hypothetical protein
MVMVRTLVTVRVRTRTVYLVDKNITITLVTVTIISTQISANKKRAMNITYGDDYKQRNIYDKYEAYIFKHKINI